jgi:hypothetical protein
MQGPDYNIGISPVPPVEASLAQGPDHNIGISPSLAPQAPQGAEVLRVSEDQIRETRELVEAWAHRVEAKPDLPINVIVAELLSVRANAVSLIAVLNLFSRFRKNANSA